MKYSYLLFLLFNFGCNSEIESKEEVMESFLVALSECNIERLDNLSVEKYDKICVPYETEIIKIECNSEGDWISCCCEENIAGHSELNGKIYSKYTLEKIDGIWKVGEVNKESDLGRDGINICD